MAGVNQPSNHFGTKDASESEVDTLELELSPQQLNALTEISEAPPRSGRSQDAVNARRANDRQSRASRPRPRRAVRTLILLLTVLGVGSAAVVALLWSREAPVQPPRAVPASLPPRTAVPEPSAVPPDPPVRVRNPFDASEWFEFPAGTPLEQAREQVAAQLMERARDRRSQPEFMRGLGHKAARTHKSTQTDSTAPPSG